MAHKMTWRCHCSYLGMCLLQQRNANWQLTGVAKNGYRGAAASWFASSGQIPDLLMGSALCVERGRQRKCSVSRS